MPIPHRSEIKAQLIELLRRNGPMRSTDAYVALSDSWSLSEEEKRRTRSGGLLYQNEIRWAGQELAEAGLIDRPSASGWAVWRLVATNSVEPDDYDDEHGEFVEGATRVISVNAYERNKKARDACLQFHGYTCAVCDFNFEQAYGEVGRSCIHVHHVVEISTIGSQYKVNPIKDLVPVCPNCHYVIHRRKPAYTIEEVRNMLRNLGAH